MGRIRNLRRLVCDIHSFRGNVYKVTRKCSEQNWILQHSKCQRQEALLYIGEDGNHACQRCFDLLNDHRLLDKGWAHLGTHVFLTLCAGGLILFLFNKVVLLTLRHASLRFLSRISNFICDMDAARLLHHRSFATEKVDDLIAEMQEKVVFKRRSKNLYQKMFAMDVGALHKQARTFHEGSLIVVYRHGV